MIEIATENQDGACSTNLMSFRLTGQISTPKTYCFESIQHFTFRELIFNSFRDEYLVRVDGQQVPQVPGWMGQCDGLEIDQHNLKQKLAISLSWVT